MDPDFDFKVRATGLRIYDLIDEAPHSVFSRDFWINKLFELCLADESFRAKVFRFIDVFPCLNTSASILRHFQEYLGTYLDRPGVNIPPVLKRIMRSVPPDSRAAAIFARPVAMAIRNIAGQFMVGSDAKDALPRLEKLRSQGIAFTIDLLGETVVSEREADEYLGKYINLLNIFGEMQKNWMPLGIGTGALDWGAAPRINTSVKVSALYSRMDPCAFTYSVSSAVERLRPLLRAAIARSAFVSLDMEHRTYKNLTLAIYKSLLEEAEFRGYPYTGIAIQAYLRESETDIREMIRWGRTQRQPFTVRLVKGAYWDSEVIGSHQNNWPVPVFTNKYATDANFERLGQIVLENQDIAALACASHNVRSIAAVAEIAAEHRVPPERIEYQVLYGMAEPIRKALQKYGLPIRIYAPIGDMLQGMSYLVRRLLENTANESFLRQSFTRDIPREEILRNPREQLKDNPEERDPYLDLAARRADKESGPYGNRGDFRNEARLDWTLAENRRNFSQALGKVRKSFPLNIPLFISGRETATVQEIRSVNPNAPEETVALVAAAGKDEAQSAIQAAKAAFPSWRDTPLRIRAEYLFRAADAARRIRLDLAALQVLEVGKGWAEADADVTEAIDYLEYYGREMINLGSPRKMGSVPGEESVLFYEPRGVGVVISPWNFPMAIPVGMASAALVTGNTVILKPASQSPAMGQAVCRIFLEAKLPPGVLNFLPGYGHGIGDLLVSHPDVALVAFTGSRLVGSRIVQFAAAAASSTNCIRHVIAEMGGKNAILVDADADLDEAVVHILHSAFSYQGQKCSACSRLIVLEAIYEKLVCRIGEATAGFLFGSPEDPKNFLGAVIEPDARKKILEYIEIGKQEGELLVERRPSLKEAGMAGGTAGYFVPLAIFTGIRPEHRLAQDEIFGPVLSVITVKDIAEAIEVANSTPYALTGGIFSRSPENIARVRREFRVGNLYINRGITGAVVGRHPFGGFRMSGVGSKSGSPEYLLQFMVQRNVVENTMRRGFAPAVERDRPSD